MTKEARFLGLRIFAGSVQKGRNFYGTQYKKRSPVLMTWRDLASPYAFDGSACVIELRDAGVITATRDGVRLSSMSDLSMSVSEFERRLAEL